MRPILFHIQLNRAQLIPLSLFLGSLTLIWLVLTGIFTQILFLLNVPISTWHLAITLFLTVLCGFIFADIWKLTRKTVLTVELGYILLVCASVLWAGNFIDLSWDGNDYQQRAIIHLRSGWNPIKTTLDPSNVYFNQAANHYPKLPWILGSGFYIVTGNIEHGKAPQALLICSVFFLSVTLLMHFEMLKPIQIVLIAMLAALNPVSTYQSLSYYVDGWGSSITIALFVLFLLLYHRFDGAVLLAILMTVIIGLNIKFTFTVYTVLLCLGFFSLLAFYWRSREIGGNVKIGRLFQVLFISVVIGICIAGYQPYIINTIKYGNPFYPVIGGTELNQTKIMEGQYPGNFIGKSGLEKLIRSIFSRSGNPIGVGSNAQFKMPFAVDQNELFTFSASDVRVGGFGPLFGGILLLACAVFIANLNPTNGQKNIVAIILIVLVSGTAFSNPEYWWARYVPQLWIIPLVLLSLVWLSQGRLNILLGWVLSFVMLTNIILIGVAYVGKNYYTTQDIRVHLAKMAAEHQTYAVDFRVFAPWRLKLEAYGIPYEDFTGRPLPCKSRSLHLIVFSKLNCP